MECFNEREHFTPKWEGLSDLKIKYVDLVIKQGIESDEFDEHHNLFKIEHFHMEYTCVSSFSFLTKINL